MKKDKELFEAAMPPVVHSRFRLPPQVSVDCSRGIGADQSFKDECDINVIMKRARETGVLIDPVALARATRIQRYEDVSQMPESFMDAMVYVQEAQGEFSKLPSAVRAKFGNNVEALLRFLADEGNRDEAIKLGLIDKKAAAVAGGDATKAAGDAPKGA